MYKIYSNAEPDLLLHVIYRIEDFKEGREEIIAPDQFIQCAALKMSKGKTFKPHKHNIREVTDKDRIAQESWVVIRGRVTVIMYDIDDTIIATAILLPGDASFTLRGGHNYIVTEDNTVVYEYKTGKYVDQKTDKTFI
jgi:hypothetical protein